MTAAIEVRGLTRRFGTFTAVHPVEFEVGQGEIFGWLGANGAGKSTTIRMLIGVLPPSGGDATVAGRSVLRDPQGVKGRIGYMSQRFSLYPDLTVHQNLSFFGGAYGRSGSALQDRIGAIARDVDLSDLLDAPTATLPGGTRQRVALGAALLHEPSIVFLDEPTAGVDPVSRRRFWAVVQGLAGRGVTVFVTTHHLDEAEQCHRVGLMVDGRLVALDSPAALAARWVPGQIWRVFGSRVHAARRAVEGRAGVLDVEPFGAALHVRVDGVPGEVVRSWVAEVCPDARVEPTRATLEDVFLAVVGAA